MTRRSAAVDYPSKERLTDYDPKDLAQRGNELAWFEPWVEHDVLMPAGAKDEPFQGGYVPVGRACDMYLFHGREELSRALEANHREHSQHSDDRELWYFKPDDPIQLPMVMDLGHDLDHREAGVAR